MQKQVVVINPIARSRADKIELLQEYLSAMGRNDIALSSVCLDNAPVSIESSIDEALCGPDVIVRAREAEKEGADAIVIDCFGDPALDAAREAVSIPVVGPGESAFHFASMLGHKFGVITVMERLRPLIENHALKYGVYSKLGSVKAVEVSVVDIQAQLSEAIGRKALESINEDGVDTIVLGCTGFLMLEQAIKDMIQKETGIDVPVVNPLPVAVLTAANMIDLKLTHSGLTYPGWPEKEVKGYSVTKLN